MSDLRPKTTFIWVISIFQEGVTSDTYLVLAIRTIIEGFLGYTTKDFDFRKLLVKES